MIWVLIVAVAVLLVAAFLAMLAGRLPYDGLSEPVHTTPRTDLPADADADDIAFLHFDTALRGYRMDQVDAVLRTLQNRVAALEDEVAGIRGPEAARPQDESTRPDLEATRFQDDSTRPDLEATPPHREA